MWNPEGCSAPRGRAVRRQPETDANAGRVTNTATATGTNPQGVPVTSGPVSATITVSKPILAVTGVDLIRLVLAGVATTAAGLLLLLLTLARRNRRRVA